MPAETALANGNQVARAIEQDFLSLANDLNGTTELGNKLVVDGVTLSTNVTNRSSCFKYAENVKQYLNSRWKNVYQESDDYAVNLHFLHSTSGSENVLKPGQIGLQCANVCASTKGNFYIHSCSCTGGTDCELFNFSKVITRHLLRTATAIRPGRAPVHMKRATRPKTPMTTFNTQPRKRALAAV